MQAKMLRTRAMLAGCVLCLAALPVLTEGRQHAYVVRNLTSDIPDSGG